LVITPSCWVKQLCKRPTFVLQFLWWMPLLFMSFWIVFCFMHLKVSSMTNMERILF
jgi:hypothetical protein